jgi:hypothetical protein
VYNLSLIFLNSINAKIIKSTPEYIEAKQGEKLHGVLDDPKYFEKIIYIKISSRADGKTYVTFIQEMSSRLLLNIFGIILSILYFYTIYTIFKTLGLYILTISIIIYLINYITKDMPRKKILIIEYWQYIETYEIKQNSIKQSLKELSEEIKLYNEKISELEKEFISSKISENEYLLKKKKLEEHKISIEKKLVKI